MSDPISVDAPLPPGALAPRTPLLRKLGLPQLGALPGGETLERMQSSPNFNGGMAQNLVPTSTGSFLKMGPVAAEYLTTRTERVPKGNIPTVVPDLDVATKKERGVRVTWLGHSSMLLNIDGVIVLTDPVFCRRASPFQWSGPERFFDTPITVDTLPKIDVVLISHDHYDHLDYETVTALGNKGHRFVTPLGVAAHLHSWGIDSARVVELDWWEHTQVGALEIHATPARHFSGRASAGANPSLWASWAFVGEHSRAWFSGDTGLFDAAADIGAKFGPFDLTLIEAGAHHPAWGEIHLGPEGALEMHRRVKGRTWMPVHWGTFNLALHAWDAPIVAAQQLAAAHGIELLSTLAGETALSTAPRVADFWRERLALASRS